MSKIIFKTSEAWELATEIKSTVLLNALTCPGILEKGCDGLLLKTV